MTRGTETRIAREKSPLPREFSRLNIIRHIMAATTDRRGNIAVLTALLLPVLVGFAGIAVEIVYWYMTQRSMQNAADSAAVAAATNAGGNYVDEAKAVAAQYGYVDGADSVSVTASDAASCPSGGSSCYSVSIGRSVSLFLSSAVGFTGSGGGTTDLSAVATAERVSTPREYCILALDEVINDNGILLNGAPSSDLSGCNMMSNSSMTCNGHNGGCSVGDAHGTNTGCCDAQNSGVDTVDDTYSGLASNIPADTCAGSYPQKPVNPNGNNADPELPAANLWTGSKDLSGDFTVCGDLQLTGDVTINAPAGAVLVIRNGQLDTNGYALRTADGSALTVVFAGDDGGYTHAPTGGGTLDIKAPTTGAWKGMALYQAPNLTTGVDISAAGNSPTWDITGLVYLPNSDVTFSGAVNKSSYGASCFAMVVSTLRINGTGSILDTGECSEAGLEMPSGTSLGRGILVN